MANIKKIKLSNGAVYSIFDEGALRLNSDHVLITGNAVVDEVIIQGKLKIAQVDDVDVKLADYEEILVQNSDTGEIMGKHKDKLLEDIGGVSASVDSQILTLKLGK